MIITEVLFRNCSPKDVANFTAEDIADLKQIVAIVSVSTGGFLFCYGEVAP